jgi:hypothetical protein
MIWKTEPSQVEPNRKMLGWSMTQFSTTMEETERAESNILDEIKVGTYDMTQNPNLAAKPTWSQYLDFDMYSLFSSH